MQAKPIGLPAGHRLRVLEEVESTNAEAVRLAMDGELGPLWVMARRQTKGRGRLGRRWYSQTGNLHTSLLLSLSCEPMIAQQLSLLAGVAIYDATLKLLELSGGAPAQLSRLRLKWPNDGLIGDHKFCGILSESLSPGPRTGSKAAVLTVTGIGINLAQAPRLGDRAVTSLKDHGINTDPETALMVLATEIAHWLGIWQEGRGFEAIRRAWCSRTIAIGTHISISIGANYMGSDSSAVPRRSAAATDAEAAPGVIHGRFAGIDMSGALLIETDELGLRSFNYGDVSWPSIAQEHERQKNGAR